MLVNKGIIRRSMDYRKEVSPLILRKNACGELTPAATHVCVSDPLTTGVHGGVRVSPTAPAHYSLQPHSITVTHCIHRTTNRSNSSSDGGEDTQ
jgi:hypothetical protein